MHRPALSLLLPLLLSGAACEPPAPRPPAFIEPDRSPDTDPPRITGPIQVGSVRQTTMRLSWPAALDDKTAVAELQYKLVRAASPEAVDSLAEVEAVRGEELLLDWQVDARHYTARGLRDSARYAFAVVVRDGAGNKALYPPVVAQASDGSAPTPGFVSGFSEIGATAATVTWTPASDGYSPQAELEYKVLWASGATPLRSVATAEALPAAQVALDWSRGASSARLTTVPDVARTWVGVLVRDGAGHKAAYAPAQPMDLQRGRLVEFTLDGAVVESSGSRPPGVLINAAATADRKGEAGKALAFSGNGLADLGPAAISGLGASATFSLWVRPTAAVTHGDYQDLFVKARVFTIALRGDGGKTMVVLNNGDGVQWSMTPVQSTGELTVGAWNHVVVTFAAGVVTFYINGAPAGSGTVLRPTLAAANECPLTMGAKLETSNPECSLLNLENHLNGALDDLRVYGRVLSPTEIAVLRHERGY